MCDVSEHLKDLCKCEHCSVFNRSIDGLPIVTRCTLAETVTIIAISFLVYKVLHSTVAKSVLNRNSTLEISSIIDYL